MLTHHPDPNFDKQADKIALVPYIPTKDTVLVEYDNLSQPNFDKQANALEKNNLTILLAIPLRLTNRKRRNLMRAVKKYS